MKGSLVRDRWMSTPSRRIVGSSGRSGFLAPHKPTISPRNCILSPGEFASYLEVSSSWEEDDEEYTAGSDDDDDISYSDGLPSDLDQSEDESPLGDDVFSFEGDEADHEPEPVPADVPFWFGHEDQGRFPLLLPLFVSTKTRFPQEPNPAERSQGRGTREREREAWRRRCSPLLLSFPPFPGAVFVPFLSPLT